MRKTGHIEAFDPRHRVRKVTIKLEYPETSTELDVWDTKLLNMYRLRTLFRGKYPKTWHAEFKEAYPLYTQLLDVYEDAATGGDKDLIEAALLAKLDCAKIVEELDLQKYNANFLALYRELFYDVRGILGNPVAEFQFIIAPLTQADSNKIAVGAIWKVLSLVGGLSALKRKGFGTDALKAEDLSYLLQLASFRNCSMILQYSVKGSALFEDNPAALQLLTTLADFDSIRGPGRRLDYLAEVSAVAKNNLSTLLCGDLKLLNVTDDVVAALSEADGAFNTNNTDYIERTEHINFLDNIREVDSAD